LFGEAVEGMALFFFISLIFSSNEVGTKVGGGGVLNTLEFCLVPGKYQVSTKVFYVVPKWSKIVQLCLKKSSPWVVHGTTELN
jgi:hypothetical protein